MSAEIIPFARWRRCGCKYCRAVFEVWNEEGPSQSLESFLVEHTRLLRPRDCSSTALRIIARQSSRLSRGVAKYILEQAWLHRRFKVAE